MSVFVVFFVVMHDNIVLVMYFSVLDLGLSLSLHECMF